MEDIYKYLQSIGFVKIRTLLYFYDIYSQTCIKRSPLGLGETGLIRQVTS